LRGGDCVGESEMKCGTLRPIPGHLEECCGRASARDSTTGWGTGWRHGRHGGGFGGGEVDREAEGT